MCIKGELTIHQVVFRESNFSPIFIQPRFSPSNNMPFEVTRKLSSVPFLLCLLGLPTPKAVGDAKPLEITRVKNGLGVRVWTAQLALWNGEMGGKL